LREFAVNYSAEPKWIPFLQRRGKKVFWKILVTHGTHEPIESSGSNRSEAHIGSCGIRPPVIHGWTNFNSCREGVND
jgi:hypothetical protein